MYLVIGTVSAFFIPAFFTAFIGQGTILIRTPRILWPFAIGTLLGIAIDHFILRHHETIETFEHEFTHAFVAVLFLRRVDNFIVTSRGGQVWHSGGIGGEFGDDMIGLAPYFLPTFTLLSSLIRPFLGQGAFPWFDIWIGLTFGYHMWSTFDELARNWSYRTFQSVDGRTTHSDIGRRGLFYSTIVIACFGLATHGFTLALMTKGYPGVRIWGRQVGQGLKAFTIFLLELIDTIIKKVS